MSRYRILVLGMMMMLLLSSLGPVWAQDSGVTMTVTPYLGGHVKYGEWLPLRVDLSNAGDELNAEVRAEIASSSSRSLYAAPVSLPAGARKQVDLDVLPPHFAQAVTVQLFDGERVLGQVDVSITPHPQNEYLIAIAAAEGDALAPLSGLSLPGRARVQLVPLSLAQLPDRVEAWRSLDLLILNGVDTSPLTSAQAQALQAWVEGGGRLVLGGGAGAGRTLAGLPEPLRPVQLGETVELSDLGPLVDFAGLPVQVPGPFLAALPAEYQGWPVIDHNQTPWLVQQGVGEGWIAYLALDPALSPFDAWAGALPFWRKLLEPDAAFPTNLPYDISPRVLESEQMGYALSNLPALDLPSVRGLGLLLGLYVLLVGPVNYVVLRRLRRLDWAWVTIPALTLAFSLGGYGLGYRLRGSDVIINQISIIPLSPEEGRLAVRSYVGLFSPTRTSYNVRVGGDALISALSQDPARWGGPYNQGSLNVLQGEPALVRGLGINQWSMQTFRAESWLEASQLLGEGETSGIDAALRIEGDQVRGTLRNGLQRPLQDVVLVSGQRFARLGDLEVGQELEVEAPLEGGGVGPPLPWALFEAYFQGPNPPSRQVNLRQSILEAYFHTNWGGQMAPFSDLTLLAWSDISPLEVEAAGVRATREQTTLVVARLPLPVVDGRVSLPSGFLSGRLMEMEEEAGECGPSGQVYLARGRVALDYQLPSGLRGLDPTRLTLHVGTDGGFANTLPRLSLYDWEAGEWQVLEGVEVGQVFELSEPDRFLNPASGTLRLEARGDELQGYCYQFDIGLEGELPSW